MATMNDSILERAQRVEHSLRAVGDPTAQAAVGGPCPKCEARIETVLHADTPSVSCGTCGSEFRIAS